MLNNATLTFTRTAEGTITKGVVASGTVTTYQAIGNLQPASINNLEMIEPGFRDRDALLFITATTIKNNDRTVVNGLNYFVKSVENFKGNLIGKCEAILLKERGQNAV